MSESSMRGSEVYDSGHTEVSNRERAYWNRGENANGWTGRDGRRKHRGVR